MYLKEQDTLKVRPERCLLIPLKTYKITRVITVGGNM
jgi:hypothetical protein